MSISVARIQLVSAFPYYGEILQNCLFSWSPSVGTAGVGLDKKGRVHLVVSPKFWDELSEPHRVGLLMHEMLHLAMDHNVGAKRDQGMVHKLANIAEDIAINQYIPSDLLPNGALLPSTYGFEAGLAFEEYYLELLKLAEKNQQPEKQETMDNHDVEIGDGEPQDGDGESSPQDAKGQNGKPSEGGKPADASEGQDGDESGLSKEIQKSIVRDLVTKAARAVGAGKVPMHVQSILPDFETKPAKVRWPNLLRKYMGRHLSNQVESTRNKPNRRLGFSAQGAKREHAPKAMFGFDESGSMSDDDLQNVASEARQILKALSDKTDVVHFDTKIAHIEKLSKIKTITRYAGGGTDFTPLVELANSKGIDLLVILSDGDGPMRVTPKMPIIWISPTKTEIRHKGEKIHLDQK